MATVEYNEEYWDGRKYVNAQNSSVLLNPTQELANSIATGPQDDLYSALDRFNGRLPDDVKLAVTPSWNWKPGTIPKFREYLINTIYKINGKSNGLEHLMRRTREWSWNYRYWENNLRELEALKYSLKEQGYSPNVDIEEFKQRLTQIVTKLEKEADLVREMTQSSVTIKILVSGLDNPRYATLHFDIMLMDLNMSIFQRDKLLHEAPLSPIHIIFSISLRKYINSQDKKRYNTSSLYSGGLYLSNRLDSTNNRYTTETHFPYISNAGRERYTNNIYYGTVCLDKYNDEVKTSIMKGDLVNATMSLMSWAQYYNTDYSHPYNNLNLLQLGMPGSYSKEYAAVVGHHSNCPNTLYIKYDTGYNNDNMKNIVNRKEMHDYCNSIKCQFSEICTTYQNEEMAIAYLEDEEHRYKVEGFIGELMERDLTIDDKYFLLDYYVVNVNISTTSQSDFLDNLMWVMRAKSPRNLSSCYRNFYPIEPEVSEPLTEEQQREAVLRFATGSR